MTDKHIVPINIPKGIPPKKFNQWLGRIQKRVSALSANDSKLVEQMFLDANLRKEINNGSISFNINQLLKEKNHGISDESEDIIRQFMKFKSLKMLQAVVIAELESSEIGKEVMMVRDTLNDTWKTVGDFWEKRFNLIGTGTHKVIRVSKGIEAESGKFIRIEGVFHDKNGRKVGKDKVIYSAYLADLER